MPLNYEKYNYKIVTIMFYFLFFDFHVYYTISNICYNKRFFGNYLSICHEF